MNVSFPTCTHRNSKLKKHNKPLYLRSIMSRSRKGVLLMEDRTAARLTRAFQKMLERSGVDVSEIAETLAAPSHINSEEKAQIPGAIRDFFVSKLKVAAEPTAQQLSRLTVALRTFPLHDVKKYLLERAKALPSERSGRPKLLGKQEEADLTATISERLSIGVEKTDAMRGAAAKFGVSLWTAKRAWQRFQASMDGSNNRPKRSPKCKGHSKTASAHRKG